MVKATGTWGRIQLGAWLSLLLVGAAAAADVRTREECQKVYQPSRGQAGKDVIWVPTEDALVTRMLQMARVTASDRVYDLGAGDGKIAIAAGKQFGATAVGIEYNPDMARYAQCLVEAEGMTQRVRVVQGDIFQSDFSSATVVTLYLLPELNLRLRPTLLDMKPGTRVVSHSFLMDDWEPDDRALLPEGSAYLWIVPAKLEGNWVLRAQEGTDSIDLQLVQQFQKLSGAAAGAPVADGRINGPAVSFAFARNGELVRVAGRMEGERLVATLTRAGRSANYIGTLR